MDDVIEEMKPSPIQVTPPGCKPVWLRYPSYGEWHRLAAAHRQCVDGTPPASLIAETVAACLADEQGNRKLSDAKAGTLLNYGPRTVMWLYKKCWNTVLKNDDELVAEVEKNSAAGQD